MQVEIDLNDDSKLAYNEQDLQITFLPALDQQTDEDKDQDDNNSAPSFTLDFKTQEEFDTFLLELISMVGDNNMIATKL